MANSDDEEAEGRLPYIPLAELLRRRAKATAKVDDTGGNIDDEIKRLEAELEADVDSASDSEDDEDDRSRHVRFGEHNDKVNPSYIQHSDPKEAGVICLSEVSDARIEALPASCLPAMRRKRGSQDDREDGNKKQKKFSGLQEAVKEVIAGYVARSSERLPFYCRACSQQYPNNDEFLQHKETEFHTTAVEMERKASFCKLCRKQFTSPVQLKEHLSSKPHKDYLLRMRGRQQQPRRDGSRQWS